MDPGFVFTNWRICEFERTLHIYFTILPVRLWSSDWNLSLAVARFQRWPSFTYRRIHPWPHPSRDAVTISHRWNYPQHVLVNVTVTVTSRVRCRHRSRSHSLIFQLHFYQTEKEIVIEAHGSIADSPKPTTSPIMNWTSLSGLSWSDDGSTMDLLVGCDSYRTNKNRCIWGWLDSELLWRRMEYRFCVYQQLHAQFFRLHHENTIYSVSSGSRNYHDVALISWWICLACSICGLQPCYRAAGPGFSKVMLAKWASVICHRAS
jgi:hypothetical protein